MEANSNANAIGSATPPPSSHSALQKKLKKMVSMPSRWALIDSSSGDATTIDVDKYDITHRLRVDARDLRILDPLLSYPSSIIGRGNAVIINLEHAKCVVTRDLVLLRDPNDPDVVPILEELRRRLQPTNIGRNTLQEDDEGRGAEEENGPRPFELRAMEVVLEAVCSFLDARTTELETKAYPALDGLTSKVNVGSLDDMRRLKGGMTRLTNRVRKVRDELERLLDDDDDMEDLCLSMGAVDPAGTANNASSVIGATSSTADGNAASSTSVDQVEMLLEVYFSQIDNTLGRLTALQKYVDATEEYLNIRIDNRRNMLIQMELLINAATVCLSVHSLVAGVFGMSLPNPWRKGHEEMFSWVVVTTTVVCVMLYGGIMWSARRKGVLGS